jgi:hypothetical protein
LPKLGNEPYATQDVTTTPDGQVIPNPSGYYFSYDTFDPRIRRNVLLAKSFGSAWPDLAQQLQDAKSEAEFREVASAAGLLYLSTVPSDEYTLSTLDAIVNKLQERDVPAWEYAQLYRPTEELFNFLGEMLEGVFFTTIDDAVDYLLKEKFPKQGEQVENFLRETDLGVDLPVLQRDELTREIREVYPELRGYTALQIEKLFGPDSEENYFGQLAAVNAAIEQFNNADPESDEWKEAQDFLVNQIDIQGEKDLVSTWIKGKIPQGVSNYESYIDPTVVQAPEEDFDLLDEINGRIDNVDGIKYREDIKQVFKDNSSTVESEFAAYRNLNPDIDLYEAIDNWFADTGVSKYIEPNLPLSQGGFDPVIRSNPLFQEYLNRVPQINRADYEKFVYDRIFTYMAENGITDKNQAIREMYDLTGALSLRRASSDWVSNYIENTEVLAKIPNLWQMFSIAGANLDLETVTIEEVMEEVNTASVSRGYGPIVVADTVDYKQVVLEMMPDGFNDLDSFTKSQILIDAVDYLNVQSNFYTEEEMLRNLPSLTQEVLANVVRTIKNLYGSIEGGKDFIDDFINQRGGDLTSIIAGVADFGVPTEIFDQATWQAEIEGRDIIPAKDPIPALEIASLPSSLSVMIQREMNSYEQQARAEAIDKGLNFDVAAFRNSAAYKQRYDSILSGSADLFTSKSPYLRAAVEAAGGAIKFFENNPNFISFNADQINTTIQQSYRTNPTEFFPAGTDESILRAVGIAERQAQADQEIIDERNRRQEEVWVTDLITTPAVEAFRAEARRVLGISGAQIVESDLLDNLVSQLEQRFLDEIPARAPIEQEVETRLIQQENKAKEDRAAAEAEYEQRQAETKLQYDQALIDYNKDLEARISSFREARETPVGEGEVPQGDLTDQQIADILGIKPPEAPKPEEFTYEEPKLQSRGEITEQVTDFYNISLRSDVEALVPQDPLSELFRGQLQGQSMSQYLTRQARLGRIQRTQFDAPSLTRQVFQPMRAIS